MRAGVRARSGSTTVDRPDGGFADRLIENRWAVVVTASVGVAILLLPSGLSPVARLTLALFAALVVLTSFSKLNEVGVCVAVLVGLVVVGGSSVGDAAAAATSDTVWLLIGAFVVAAAARASGIAERMAFAIGSQAESLAGLSWRLTFGIVATAFLVPSTSGRAALLLPVYLAVAEHLPEVKARRALSVLFPSVVLLSAVASLFGAGAHLVTVELVAGLGGDPIGLVEWTLYGLPFALASSSIATWVILRMFLDEEQRMAPVDLPVEQRPWGRPERIVGWVLAAMVVLWLTESIHGVSPSVVAIMGALIVLVGPLAIVTVREAWSAIPVGLLVLLVVTAEAGAALARTGGADWIASTVLGPIMDGQSPAVVVVAVVAIVSLMMHLVITSRTARASVLVPIVILIAGAAGLDITAVAFLATVGAGYCLTTTTSAKPIRVFATVDDGYTATDLRQLSMRLVPLHFLLLLAFTFFAWPALGMPIDERAAAGSAEERVYPWDRIVIGELDVGPRIDRSPVEESGSVAPSRVVLPVPSEADVPGVDPAVTSAPDRAGESDDVNRAPDLSAGPGESDLDDAGDLDDGESEDPEPAGPPPAAASGAAPEDPEVGEPAEPEEPEEPGTEDPEVEEPEVEEPAQRAESGTEDPEVEEPAEPEESGTEDPEERTDTDADQHDDPPEADDPPEPEEPERDVDRGDGPEADDDESGSDDEERR